MCPDDPVGGIWSVRSAGAEARQPEREGEKERRDALRRRRQSRDSVTLSAEARRLSKVDREEESPGEQGETEEEGSHEKND